MTNQVELVIRFKLTVDIHDENLSVADYVDEMEYDFQSGAELDADIQDIELIDYDILNETPLFTSQPIEDIAMRYIHRMEDDNE